MCTTEDTGLGILPVYRPHPAEAMLLCWLSSLFCIVVTTREHVCCDSGAATRLETAAYG